MIDWKEEARKYREKADLAVKVIQQFEKLTGIPVYSDGLPFADPSVFDPFFKGTKLMAEYKWDEAIAEFKRAMKEAKASELVALHGLIGFCYHIIDKPDSAMENYNKSLSLAQEFNEKEAEVFLLVVIGSIFKSKSDLERATKYIEDALRIAKETGYKEGEALALNALGFLSRSRGDLNQALKQREQALRIAKETGNKEGEAIALASLGSFFLTKEKWDEALRYSLEALRISKEVGCKPAEAMSLSILGGIYQDKDEKEKALEYYEDALKIFTEIGFKKEEFEMLRENIEMLKGG